MVEIIMDELIDIKKLTLKKIGQKKAQIILLTQTIKSKEHKLLLTTDFKAEGLTNEKMRNAFISEELFDETVALDWAKYDLFVFENELSVINDLIQGELNGIKK